MKKEDLSRVTQELALLHGKIHDLESQCGGEDDDEFKKEFSYIIELYREYGDVFDNITTLTHRIIMREGLASDPSLYGQPEHFVGEQEQLPSITTALTALDTHIEDIMQTLERSRQIQFENRKGDTSPEVGSSQHQS